jgi:hypothetical protein
MTPPGHPERWSYSDSEVWVCEPVLVRPELLQGPAGEVLMQRFRVDGRHHEHGGDACEYLEFSQPRRFDETDLLVRRRDLGRWKVLTAAAAQSDQQIDRLKAVLAVAIEQGQFSLSSNEARQRLGVSLNSLYEWRRRAEALGLPLVWQVINPAAKRKQYRWLADEEALRDWGTLLELVRGGGGATGIPAKPARRVARRAPVLRKGAVGRELDELLG